MFASSVEGIVGHLVLDAVASARVGRGPQALDWSCHSRHLSFGLERGGGDWSGDSRLHRGCGAADGRGCTGVLTWGGGARRRARPRPPPGSPGMSRAVDPDVPGWHCLRKGGQALISRDLC